MRELLNRVKQTVTEIEAVYKTTEAYPVWVAFIPTVYKEARHHLNDFASTCLRQYISEQFPKLREHILTEEQRDIQKILYETIDNE